MKKWLIALAVVAVLIVGWVWWRAAHTRENAYLVLHGNVDIRQVSLAFDNNGRVAEVLAEEGDTVKRGQLLATLDTTSLQLQADEATADLQVQEQTVLKMRNGSRPQELAQERAKLAAAQADAAKANRDLQRLEQIGAETQGRGVSPQDLDSAKNSAASARAKLEEQQQALRLSELGPREEEVAGAAAQFNATKAKLAQLQYQLSQGELRAPADAVVRSRLLEPGDMASSSRAAFSLALTQPKWIRVYVSETDLGKVQPGAAAQVTTDSHPNQPIHGRVGYISSVAEFTPKSVQTEELRTNLVYEVRVLVEDPQNALRLGQPATVSLMAGSLK